ncbi:MAG: glycosyltransferase family 2 protein [Bacteroidales bacterium]|jgi:glycosyltransferase involved in cell wall biosynthesis|nr:glycosyltransferase family 2 protein [Bacteroidales bacterium]
MNISVVVPLLNEAESLPELCAWIERVVDAHHFSYEICLIDDGSTDESWAVIERLASQNPNIHAVKFRRNYGKSAALNVGFEMAKGDVIITMDADLQDSPDEIPELYRMITEEGFDLVSGWKKKRYDPISKTVPTKLFNWAARKMSGVYLHDFNCGLKAYKSQVVKSIEIYGEMHRYIPVLAKTAGFRKITEKVVEHRARKYGVTKFGLSRFINGFLDLLSISFIGKFAKRPMHFFGSLGTLIFFFGLIAVVWLGFQKWLFLVRGIGAPLIADSPFFYIAIMCMIIGTQLFLAGYVAELVSRNSPTRNQYLIEKTL